jgi:hypothetical protein
VSPLNNYLLCEMYVGYQFITHGIVSETRDYFFSADDEGVLGVQADNRVNAHFKRNGHSLKTVMFLTYVASSKVGSAKGLHI